MKFCSLFNSSSERCTKHTFQSGSFSNSLFALTHNTTTSMTGDQALLIPAARGGARYGLTDELALLANVGRYARMVREMSEKVQFVFITHNKITMEMADHLMGVTMHEPGVSRLVSVDVEEAAELAAS